MGYPELVQAFANRIRGATMILARRCGRLSYERHVIQAWLIDRDSAENFTVTSLSLEAVAKGWARYAPYLKKQPDAPRELLETAQKPEVMEEAEKVAEQKKLGMFAREGAPTLKQIEAHRAAKKGPTSEQNA
jgi:endonuclease YncB( thermonuclease family)